VELDPLLDGLDEVDGEALCELELPTEELVVD